MFKHYFFDIYIYIYIYLKNCKYKWIYNKFLSTDIKYKWIYIIRKILKRFFSDSIIWYELLSGEWSFRGQPMEIIIW